MREKTYNIFSNISLNKGQIFDSEISEGNFSNKNICLIKTATPPEATAELVGATFLYIGENTDDFKNSTLYICKEEGEEEKTYKWESLGKLGGDGVKTAETLPSATAENLGSVYLVDKVFYQNIKKEEEGETSYSFEKLGYIDEWVEEEGGELKPSISKNKLNELKNVDIGTDAEQGHILIFNGEKWANKKNTFEKGTLTTQAVGGIAKNADIGDMSPYEILNLMLVGNLDAENLVLNEIETVYSKNITLETLTLKATCRSESDALAYIKWYRDGAEVHKDELSGTFAEVEYTFENISEDTELKAILTLTSGLTSEGVRNIKFVYPSYYGFEGGELTELLNLTKTAIINYNATGLTQPVYKYPYDYGALNIITDESGMDDFTKGFNYYTEEIGSVKYYVYLKKDPALHKNMKYWFH